MGYDYGVTCYIYLSSFSLVTDARIVVETNQGYSTGRYCSGNTMSHGNNCIDQDLYILSPYMIKQVGVPYYNKCKQFSDCINHI